RVDNTHDDAFTHTVRLEDPDRALEVAIVATPSPDYAIRAARCRVERGEVAASVADGVARLAGVAMVGGLTRRVMEAAGGGAGAPTARAPGSAGSSSAARSRGSSGATGGWRSSTRCTTTATASRSPTRSTPPAAS